MRKVVAYEIVSLDGVAEAPDRFFDWDDVMDANLSEVIATQDAVVLGRGSYDEWAGFWPTSDIEPFASFINSVPKYVATSTPLDPAWSNAQVMDEALIDFVRHRKEESGGDIGVHGSISVARSLIAAGVVDELRLVVSPVVVGAGKKLFDDVPSVKLHLLRSVASPTGHLLVDYRLAPQPG